MADPIVVVGAGPAGLAAAARAAQSGARVVLLDDNPNPGGQIWRADSSKAPVGEAARWLQAAGNSAIERVNGARVVAAPAPSTLEIETFDGAREIRYSKLVLATGARERFLPFPGWTLPNVMGAGGLQALAKSGFPIAGKSVVVAGSGPLLLAVAQYLDTHGARVRLIAEQAEQSSITRFGLGLVRHPGKLIQAMGLRASLRPIPYMTGCWPTAAHGSGKLERVSLRRGAKTWDEPCDFLACGFGLVPNLELPLLLRCDLGETGVAVDEMQQASVTGVYAAGEVTGIGGLDLSLAEGEIAGYAAAGQPDRARALFSARASARRFAAALENAFALREELKALPWDETLVCRCEDVAFGRIRKFSGWREAKLQTRCGMGPCQGRVCGPALEFLLDWRTESVRPPVYPARIATLAGTSEPQPRS